MFEIIDRVIGRKSTKCVAYTIRNIETGMVGVVSRDMLNALVNCSLVKDVTMDKKGRLEGLGDYRISSIRNRTLALGEENNFNDLSYFEDGKVRNMVTNDTQKAVKKKAVVRTSEHNSKNDDGMERSAEEKPRIRNAIDRRLGFKEQKTIEKTKQTTLNVLEIKRVGVDDKTGHCYVICSTTNSLYTSDFKNVAIKSKQDDNFISFTTYLKNLQYKVSDMSISKNQVIVTKNTLVSLKRGIAKAKDRKVQGVDVFNIVNPTTHQDLLEFYGFLCKNAIYIESDVIWKR